jgi:hypothetical protein
MNGKESGKKFGNMKTIAKVQEKGDRQEHGRRVVKMDFGGQAEGFGEFECNMKWRLETAEMAQVVASQAAAAESILDNLVIEPTAAGMEMYTTTVAKIFADLLTAIATQSGLK